MTEEIFEKIKQSIIDCDPESATNWTQEGLSSGIEPMDIIEKALVPGMDIVGERFSSGEYFLPNLIISAEGMRKSLALLEPELHKRQQKVKNAGVVVIGTVRGDIHEIGKSLVGTMLGVNGFQVHDLGADVPIETFIEKIKETGATLVGLSALLTTTMTVQRDVIIALEKENLRKQVKVMVGGAPVTRSWAEEIGADGFAEDAMTAVHLAKELVGAGD
jgi:corrinoid protein of di/trimethylamine methyltransferase